MGVNSLPKTVTRQCHGCDLNPGPSAPASGTLTTRLPSHCLNSNNNDNNYDSFFSVNGAVIMTKVIARVHTIHLMNVDLAPVVRQPSDQAKRLGLSPPKIGSYRPHPPSPLLLLLSP